MLAVGARLIVNPYFFRVKHSDHEVVTAALDGQADLDFPWISNTS